MFPLTPCKRLLEGFSSIRLEEGRGARDCLSVFRAGEMTDGRTYGGMKNAKPPTLGKGALSMGQFNSFLQNRHNFASG